MFITKILIFILILSIFQILGVICHIINCFIKNKKFKMTRLGKILSSVSASYILTIIFTGL